VAERYARVITWVQIVCAAATVVSSALAGFLISPAGGFLGIATSSFALFLVAVVYA
jgi:hypothetical protein